MSHKFKGHGSRFIQRPYGAGAFLVIAVTAAFIFTPVSRVRPESISNINPDADAAIPLMVAEMKGNTEWRKGKLRNSIVVTPLRDSGLEPGYEYIATGIHKEILLRLSMIGGLNLVDFSPALIPDYTDESLTVQQIAQELKVENIMQGMVRYENGKLDLNIQLIDGVTGKQLWSSVYSGDPVLIFSFLADIAIQSASMNQIEIPRDVRLRVNKQLTTSQDAYMYFLRALTLAPELNSAVPMEFYDFLDRAITIDPGFAMAHAFKAAGLGMAIANGIQINGMTFEAMEKIALDHVADVMLQDPEISMSYLAQAFIHWNHQRGTPARASFERALKLSPNDIVILGGYARFLSITGDHVEAERMAMHAAELSTTDSVYHELLGEVYFYAGKLTAAEDSIRTAISFSPSRYEPHVLYGLIELVQHNNDKAISELRIAEQLLNNYSPHYEDLAIHIYACSILGLDQDAQRLFSQFDTRVDNGEYISASALVLAYLAMGHNNVAFDVLSRSPNEGTSALKIIKTNILHDPVLDASRFDELRRRIGMIGGRSNLYIPPF